MTDSRESRAFGADIGGIGEQEFKRGFAPIAAAGAMDWRMTVASRVSGLLSMFFHCLMPSFQGMAYHNLLLAPVLQQFGAWSLSKGSVRSAAISEVVTAVRDTKPIQPRGHPLCCAVRPAGAWTHRKDSVCGLGVKDSQEQEGNR